MSEATKLDRVLSQPLAAVSDDGFSERVTLRLIEARARRARRVVAALAGSAALVCLAMPFTAVGQTINAWVLALGEQISAPLAVTAGTLVGAALIVQFIAEMTGSATNGRSSP